MKKLIPLLLVFPILFSGCSASGDNPTEKIKSQTTPQEIYIFTGKVQADNSATVSSKINAKITQIKVDVGTKINAGDPIIYLDTQDIQASLHQAEASVATSQANLNKVTTGTRPEQLAVAQASATGAKDAYVIAQKNYDRQKELFKNAVNSQINVDQAEQTLASTKAQYDSAAQNLTMLQNGATQSDINIALASVNQAQSSVSTAQTSLNYGVITAPISGTVTVKNINEGEMSGVGQPIITIVNSEQLHIDSYVPEEFLLQLKIGQLVNVKISQFPNNVFEGEITMINQQIDSRNKSALVKIGLKNGVDVLKPGMFAEIGLKSKVGK